MRIGIDARFFGPIGKGLGRYTQKLIEKLEKVDQSNAYFVFLRKENFEQYHPRNKNFKKVLADYAWYSFSEQFGLIKLLRKYRLDLVHFPHFNVPLLYLGRFVVTIHDLILIHFPTRKNTTLHPFFYWIKFLAYRLVIRAALMRSEKVITVSNFTKNDIRQKYPKLASEKIIVTYEACEDYCISRPAGDVEILQSHGIIKPYIVYVGNAYPHKNLERLVAAFSLVKNKDLRLVLVGKKDYFYARLRKIITKKSIANVIFAGFVSDCELETVLRNSLALIFPSLYEGFGLPPLEAMKCGVPVISSDHPCMREILAESVWYFDGLSEKSIAQSIEDVTSNQHLRERLVELGYQQVRKYSWEKMARETKVIYESVFENKNAAQNID